MTGLRVGGGAKWICGGGLERAVLTGRVVILAVTGRVLLRDRGSCWINGVISGRGYKRQVIKTQISMSVEPVGASH